MDEPKLPPGHSRETTIRRDAEGRWFHDGEPVTNDAVARAFDRWVGRAEDGRYILKNDVNWAYVEIEGAPVFVRDAEVGGSTVTMRLSTGEEESLRPETLREDADGVLYCTVSREGGMAARFDRKAMFALEPVVREDERGVFLDLGERVRPKRVDDPLR